jgi:hypothetical protein
MGKLAGACIDLNKKYGSTFSGGFNALITNIKTLRVGTSHLHCPDCKVSFVFSLRTASRVCLTLTVVPGISREEVFLAPALW